MNLHVSVKESNERSRNFHKKIAAIHHYKNWKGANEATHWPDMWMWELVTMPVKMPKATMDRIISLVCAEYRTSRPELLSPSRHAKAVRARFIVAYMARKMTRLSFWQIGKWMCRDHTTIIYAYNRMTKMIESDPGLAKEIVSLMGRLS